METQNQAAAAATCDEETIKQRTSVTEQDGTSQLLTSQAEDGQEVAEEPPEQVDGVVTRRKDCKQRQDDYRLRRGFSKASINLSLVFHAREKVLIDISGADEVDDQPQYIAETPVYSFVLPNIHAYPEGLKAFLFKDLVEMPTLVTLEQGGFLNWWADMGIGPRLYPMVTTGDGNCLLHAASLAMWGFHDRQLTLRKLLSCNMKNGQAASSFHRRWRWQQIQINKQIGLIMMEEEWQAEWEFLVNLARPLPKTTPAMENSLRGSTRSFAGKSIDTQAVFESLEELHVFVLAHVLRRPIIVIAKSVLTNAVGEALAPIPFGGIYLPLECSPAECHRSPLLLTYDSGHFCALVWMDGAVADLAIPVVSPKLELLTVHFSTDPGPDFDWTSACEDDIKVSSTPEELTELLKQYMDVKQVRPKPGDNGTLGRVQRRASIESGSGSEEDRKPRQFHGVVKTFGSLGHTVSRKIKQIAAGGSRSRKASIGSATQSSRTSTLTTEMLADDNQVLVASLTQRSMYHQDELVNNYLTHATQRYDELRAQRQRQADELQRRLSCDQAPSDDGIQIGSTADDDGVSNLRQPAFDRQNTLFLTGRSKFYTLSNEDHFDKANSQARPEGTSQTSPGNVSDEKLVKNRSSMKSLVKNRDGGRNEIATPSSDKTVDGPAYDCNYNELFSLHTAAPSGLNGCPHAGLPSTEYLCSACYHAQRYSIFVGYPTTCTRL